MRPCPIEHQPKGAGLEVARKHCPVDRHRSTKPSVVGMKVCYRMVPLVPVHVDHDTVEGAHPWHVPTRVDGSEYRGREGRSRRCGAYSGIMPTSALCRPQGVVVARGGDRANQVGITRVS